MPKNTSNTQFGQVLSEIWPPEVFWVSKLMWAGADGYIRAHMANGCAQTGMYEVQALLHAHSKSKELWKAMFHLDLV